MAISRLYTFADGSVPTAAQINGELNNIINNARDLISPLTSTLDMNGLELILDADADTSVISSTDDRIDFKLGGVSNLFRLDGTTASSVNGVHLIATATGVNPRVEADGTDTNVGLRLAGQGTGAVLSDGPVSILAQIMGFSNVSLASSVASSAWTIALKDDAGNDPSTASPCKVYLRSATLTTGTPVRLSRTSALSIVVPNTAVLGTTNGVAYRIWVGATTTDGTTWDALCIFNTQGTSQIHPLPSEEVLQSCTAISTGSDSAGVLYGSSATTNMPLKWIGYIEISEASAGVWDTEETKIQLLGPGVHRSGDILQTTQTSYSTQTNNDTSTYADTGLTLNITPSSAPNRVLVHVHQGGVSETTNLGGITLQLVRGSTSLIEYLLVSGGIVDENHIVSWTYLDAPAATTATTYKTQIKHVTNNARARAQNNSTTSTILLQEIFV